MDHKLLKILACPLCKAELVFDSSRQELICRQHRLAYPIKHGVPVMLVEQARKLSEAE